MARAYVLVETAIGKAQSVVEALRRVPGVKSADAITGYYNVMVVVEGKHRHEIEATIMRHIWAMPDVEQTTIYFVVE